MKSIQYSLYILLLVALTLSTQSCFKEEKDLFGQSAAERMQLKINEINELLNSSPNGWLMEYYAGYDDGMYGGFPLLCRFDEGTVEIAGAILPSDKFAQTGEVHKSSYTINATQGPVLSFDTYNMVLHPMSDPGVTSGLGETIEGMAGDYEFTVMEMSDNLLVLRGVKHKLRIILRKLDADRDWDDICNGIKALQDKLINLDRFEIRQSGKIIGMTSLYSDENTIYNTEGKMIQKEQFIISEKGIETYEPLIVDGVSLKGFIWNDEAQKFVSKEDPRVEMLPTLIDYTTLAGKYLFTADNLEGSIEVNITLKGGGNGDGKTLIVDKSLLGASFEMVMSGNRAIINPQDITSANAGGLAGVKLMMYTRSQTILGTNSYGYYSNYPMKGRWFSGTHDSPLIQLENTVYTNRMSFSINTTQGIRMSKYVSSSATAEFERYLSPLYLRPKFSKLKTQ